MSRGSATVKYLPVELLQFLEVILIGWNGAHAVSPVDRESRSESDCATILCQPMGAGRVRGGIGTQGAARLHGALVNETHTSTAANTQLSYWSLEASRIECEFFRTYT